MTEQKTNLKSALFCAAIASKIHQSPVTIEQIKHLFGGFEGEMQPINLAEVLQEIGFKATVVKKDLEKIKSAFFPLIGQLDNGDFVLLAKLGDKDGSILTQKLGENRGQWIKIEELKKQLLPQVIFIKRQIERMGQITDFGIKWFLKASMKYWSVLRDCLMASFFVQVFGLLSPLVFMIIIDKVLGNNSLSTLDVLIFALIVVSLFEILLNGLRTYLMSHTANRIDLMLGVRLFKHLMNLPLCYFESRQVGDTIARMRELENVRRFITGSAMMLGLDLLFLVVFLFVMFLFSPFLTTIVLCAMPVLFGVSFILTPFLRDKLENRYAVSSSNQSFLVETIGGIETIKGSAAEPRIREKWENRLAEQVKVGFAGGHLANFLSQTTGIISKILSVLLLWLGAKEVLAGNLTVGQLIAFNMLSSRTIAPILRLSQIWKEFQQVNISIARIGDIFNNPTEPGFNPDKVSLPSISGDVKFDHVSFRYKPDGKEILSDINFSVKAGEVIGIVGSTGSGKTTLAKLLQRLYVPEKGRVLIDGVDLSVVDVSWLRRQIGVVLQDGVLFNASIRDNIGLNTPGLEMDAIIKAAKLAGAHEFILEMPDGYNTLAGERGQLLSAGQRQRIAIARALATNPRMLIFDEATSSLDYESELLVQKNMKQICTDRTTFIIAHRLSTVRHADRILTLENGRLVEDNSPEELLKKNGRYALLHSIQEGSFG